MKEFEYGIGLAHLKYFHPIKFLDTHKTEYQIPLYDLVFHFHCVSLKHCYHSTKARHHCVVLSEFSSFINPSNKCYSHRIDVKVHILGGSRDIDTPSPSCLNIVTNTEIMMKTAFSLFALHSSFFTVYHGANNGTFFFFPVLKT